MMRFLSWLETMFYAIAIGVAVFMIFSDEIETAILKLFDLL